MLADGPFNDSFMYQVLHKRSLRRFSCCKLENVHTEKGFVNLKFLGKFRSFLYYPYRFVGMNLMFDFPQSWVILFGVFLLVWAVLLFSRKKIGRKEVKEQVYLAVAGLFSLFLMEVFATQSNLWHYIPGDWPVILWPTYVAAILFGYQLLRFIEERLVMKRVDLR